MMGKLRVAWSTFCNPDLLLLSLSGAIRNGAGIVWAYNILVFFNEYWPDVDVMAAIFSFGKHSMIWEFLVLLGRPLHDVDSPRFRLCCCRHRGCSLRPTCRQIWTSGTVGPAHSLLRKLEIRMTRKAKKLDMLQNKKIMQLNFTFFYPTSTNIKIFVPFYRLVVHPSAS